MTAAPRLLVASGARAAEEALLAHLENLFEEARADPRRLGQPVRVVVPSVSLRRHLLATIVRRRGRSACAVTVQTLHQVAREILERAGEPTPVGQLLEEVVPARLAREEPSLRCGLEGLTNAYRAAAASVRDLLDAGLEPEHAAPLDEALATTGGGTAEQITRARALVRVATLTRATFRTTGIGHRSELLIRAAELLAGAARDLLPARALFIHGFSDATGVATDLLAALLARPGARAVLDLPPGAGAGLTESRFGAGFRERLRAVAGVPAEASPAPGAEPDLTAFAAVGSEAEVRELALRLRALLDTGERAEGIGVVARDLGPYRGAIRRHFGRLAIPFSGLAEAGSLTPSGRLAAALVELLRRRERIPTDRWLDALAALPAADPGGPRRRIPVDLRLALAALGAGRLADVAGLDPRQHLIEGLYPLPLRRGFVGPAPDGEVDGDEAPEPAPGAPRRSLEGDLLSATVATAAATLRTLADWPDKVSVESHLGRLRELLATLGWRRDDRRLEGAWEAVDQLAEELPPSFELTCDEIRQLLTAAAESRSRTPLGGLGGGIQVLSVTEARALTFAHLFLLGLNRDVFPRVVREDPLLPDDLRRLLSALLPDLPLKTAGFAEERFLFAQLLSAAPRITLSWQVADDDGAPRAASPLVARLPASAATVPGVWSAASGALRPAREHATLAGLLGNREHFERVLGIALGEAPPGGGPRVPPPAAERLAAVRRAVLDELDPDLGSPAGREVAAAPGPFFGFVGPVRHPADPRRHPPWVTQLEGVAGCPWQTFLGRLLALEPSPDPLEVLPGLDPLLLGNAVHRALETLVVASGAHRRPRFEEMLSATPRRIPWPTAEELAALSERAAAETLRHEGIHLPGLTRALALLVRPCLEAARQVDWPDEGPQVLAAETEGRLTVDGPEGPCEVLFRADRLDRGRDGELVLTDYKTGRNRWDAKRAETRARRLAEAVASGEWLQAAAYRRAAGAAGRGRYLFLDPAAENRVYEIGGDGPSLDEAFDAAVAQLLAARETGIFFPRLVDPRGREEPPRCQRCPVAEACLRGDSGARGRLLRWSREASEKAAWGPVFEGMWWLPLGDRPEGDGP